MRALWWNCPTKFLTALMAAEMRFMDCPSSKHSWRDNVEQYLCSHSSCFIPIFSPSSCMLGLDHEHVPWQWAQYIPGHGCQTALSAEQCWQLCGTPIDLSKHRKLYSPGSHDCNGDESIVCTLVCQLYCQLQLLLLTPLANNWLHSWSQNESSHETIPVKLTPHTGSCDEMHAGERRWKHCSYT